LKNEKSHGARKLPNENAGLSQDKITYYEIELQQESFPSIREVLALRTSY